MNLHKTLLAITLGATASFMWNYLSWGVLDLHEPAMLEFADEDAVAEVIAANAPELGAYYLPKLDHGADIDPVSEASQRKRMESGPRVTAFIRPGAGPGMDMRKTLLMSFATQMAGAAIIAILLSAVAGRIGYVRRVLFVALVGAFTGIIGIYPNHTWWEYPMAHIKPYMIDTAAGWLLAGIFMAALIKPSAPETEPEPEPESEPESESKQKPKPDSKPDPKPDSKPDRKPDRKPDSKPDSKPAPKLAPKPDSKPDSKSDSRPDSKTAPKLAPKPESKSKDNSKSDSKPAAKLPAPLPPKPGSTPGLKVQPGGAPPLKSKSEPASPGAPKLAPRPKTDSDEKPPPPVLKPRPKPDSD